MSSIITLSLILVIAITFIWGTKRNSESKFFLSKDYTTTLKGLAALIVVFVHFPEEYQNPVQDMIGSFAYVAVTIFFLFSAYGMQYGIEKKNGYLRTFWLNRFANLVIPNWMINIVTALIVLIFADSSVVSGNVFRLNHYVWVLLEYCVVFFIIEFLHRRYSPYSRRTADILLISIVVAWSIISYLYEPGTDWCYERMGLVWGLLLFRYLEQIRRWMTSRNLVKIIILFIACAIAGVCYLKFKEVWLYGQYLLKVLLGLLIIVFLFLTTVKLRIANPVTRFIGNISFEIYLSHVFVMRLIDYFVPGLESGVFIVLVFISCIAFSALVHQADKRLIALIRK